MDLSQYAELFLAESREHLGACNQLLLEWERDPGAPEPVAGLFRAVHTIKGMAATMGYGRVAELAHRTENVLDALRRSRQQPEQVVLDVLFRAVDRLEMAIGEAVRGTDAALEIADLAAELDAAAARVGAVPSSSAPPTTVGAERPPAQQPEPVGEPSGGGWLVGVALRADASLKGGRAAIVLRRAEALGSVRDVVPPATAFEAEEFDGRFTLRLLSARSPDEIAAHLRGAGDVEAVTVVAPETVPAVPAAGVPLRARTRHVRVDVRHLDALMTLIGELVVNRGRLAAVAARHGDAELADLQGSMARLVTDLQEEIVRARLTPVWQVFDRFPRLVRDLARQLNKEVGLRIEGKEIELDRAILGELGDPLVHLLRNAVDHGIEPPEERRRRGKPREGQLVLEAIREQNGVAIRVSDDGRGIDRERILERAKQEGLVDRHADGVRDDLLLRLLARPGFSTAAAVSQVSGRGVGIDVVTTRVRALGGSVDMRSEPGRGTSFTLRLPVTLAIVRALLARVGRECYALPLTHVAETVELETSRITTVGGREALLVRDRLVPLVHLDQALGIERDGAVAPARRPVIILASGERRTGVVVDVLAGQQEIVVKGFTPPRGTLPLFSGATVLGDGVPALILDAGGLL